MNTLHTSHNAVSSRLSAITGKEKPSTLSCLKYIYYFVKTLFGLGQYMIFLKNWFDNLPGVLFKWQGWWLRSPSAPPYWSNWFWFVYSGVILTDWSAFGTMCSVSSRLCAKFMLTDLCLPIRGWPLWGIFALAYLVVVLCCVFGACLALFDSRWHRGWQESEKRREQRTLWVSWSKDVAIMWYAW